MITAERRPNILLIHSDQMRFDCLGTIEPWPSFPDPLVGKPFTQAQQRRTWHLDGWRWESWAPIVGRYLGEVSLLDANVGRLVGALDGLGLGERTLIVFTADHGDTCGGHGMIDKHYVVYDDVMHVPLVMRWPGVIEAGARPDDFVCGALDLNRTLRELAGVSTAGAMGESLVPVARGEASLARPDIFGMYHGNQFGLYSQRMVRDRRYKYVWNATAEDELYGLERDPGELVNLAAEPALSEELVRLRGRLLAWMASVDDRLLNAWTRDQLGGGAAS